MDNDFDIFLEDDMDDMFAINFIENRMIRKVYERANLYQGLEDKEFFIRFRLSKNSVLELLLLIEERLEFPHNINNSVSPINQLLVCLRVFATGGHLQTIADFGGMDVSTVSRIVVRVSQAIANLHRTFIKFPSAPDDIKKTQNSFFDIASFPRVIGVIDCTHIRIQSPGGNDAELFRNRKSYFSLNVQVVGNANLEIINIVARWPGSSHDSTIFQHSNLRRRFEQGSYPNSVLLGDSGYNVRTYLFTPLLNPANETEQLYNQAHIRTRVKIENLFGVWKRRFPVLAYGCRLKLGTVMTVIVATAILHNIARKNDEVVPPIEENMNEHELQQLIAQGQVPEIQQRQNEPAGADFEMRRNIIRNYFANL